MNGTIERFAEFDSHRFVSYISDPKTRLEGFIAIHRGTLENPAFGATRIVQYHTKVDALKDALNLSKLMSYKAALAGLPYGGAKGVIILPPNLSDIERSVLFKSYADKVNYLNGHFVTGADVGISNSDLKIMRKGSAFMEGINSKPVKFTALGMVMAIEVVLEEIYGIADMKKRTFAIQGVGKIGSELVKLLYKRAKKIYIADVNSERVNEIQRKFPNVEVVTPTQVYKQKVDVFCPCALGNSLTTKTISLIKAPIILGGANNQLETSAVGELLHKLGILYAPDYVVNAGGIISVVDQYENKRFSEKRIEKRLNNIRVILRTLLKQSKISGRAMNVLADEMAQNIFNNH